MPYLLLAVKLLPVYLLGGLAGYVVTSLGMPLGWMIGGLMVSATVTISLDVTAPPPALGRIGQVVVGSAIGLFLTPASLMRVAEYSVPILLAAALTVAAGFSIGLIERRVFRSHRATALFASIPGGPMEMASLARHYGGAGDHVALAQILRIATIVLLFPLLVLLGGAEAAPVDLTVLDANGAGLVAILCIGGAAGWLARRIGLVNPFFLGPMAAMGLLAAADLHLSDIPAPMIWTAQILLGVGLGSMFRRETLLGGRAVVVPIMAGTVALLAACCCIAASLTVLFGLDLTTMLLASAPGGVTEMTLTAKAVEADVSLVAAFHIARVFLTLPLIPVIYRAFLRLG